MDVWWSQSTKRWLSHQSACLLLHLFPLNFLICIQVSLSFVQSSSSTASAVSFWVLPACPLSLGAEEDPFVSLLGCVLEFRPQCALIETRQRVPEGPTERDPIKRQFHSMTRKPQAPHHEVLKTCSNSQAVALTGYESPQHRRYLRAVAETAEHQDDHSCW